jgi:hypothetical protein
LTQTQTGRMPHEHQGRDQVIYTPRNAGDSQPPPRAGTGDPANKPALTQP